MYVHKKVIADFSASSSMKNIEHLLSQKYNIVQSQKITTKAGSLKSSRCDFLRDLHKVESGTFLKVV